MCGATRQSAALLVAWIGAATGLLLGCQQPRTNVDQTLIGEVMMRSELAANLRAIATPGGRLTGTPGAAAATQYIIERARTYGLKNVHTEPFQMSCWTVLETDVTVLGDPPRKLADAVALARTISTPDEGVTAEVIDAGDGSEEAFAKCGERVRGKFVVVHDSRNRRGMVGRAREQGAVGVLVMMAPDRDPIIGNGHLTPRPEPIVVVRHDAALLAALAGPAPVRMTIKLRTENWDCQPDNVVAEIPGSGPAAQEVVVVGAHLDSWHLAEGALDNGTGSVTILEAARALNAIDWHPRRTIRFIWFMAEELGLEGSESYARAHADEMPRIVTMVNVDMPGSPRGFGVFGHPELKPLLGGVRTDLAGYEIDPNIAEWSGDWSDHAGFARAGVPALSISGDMGPGVKNYHTTGDKYEAVDTRATTEAAAVLSVVVRRLADADPRPGTFLPPAPPTEPAAPAATTTAPSATTTPPTAPGAK